MTLIEQTVALIGSLSHNDAVPDQVRERWNSLTKPRKSLGLLEDCVVKLAMIQDSAMPSVDRRCIYVFCGDHGITEEGVSPYPSAVTREMVKSFVHGRAAINILCRHLQIETRIVDAGVSGPALEGVIDRRVGSGTASFLHGPAMSRDAAETAIARGIELASEAATQFDLAGLGEMGIGNTTSASAILCALLKATPEEAAGKGAGLDQAGVLHKQDVLKSALAKHAVDPLDPLSAVSAFAGFEIAMMSGFILGAAAKRLPVVVDGFISGAAFLIARSFYPAMADHVFFGHRSAERAHALLLSSMSAVPLLDLQLCLGEGTGAALAMSILNAATALYREMPTFTEAAVSDIPDKEQQTA